MQRVYGKRGEQLIQEIKPVNLFLSSSLSGSRSVLLQPTIRFLPIRSDEGLTLETSAFEYLYGGQFSS